MMDPDAELMLCLKNGDRAAFEKLFEKYQRPILNFCYRFLGNQPDAEEVTQEAFIQLYHAAGRYQPLSKFSTWFYTIAKNLCLNRLRRDRNESRFGRDPLGDKEGERLEERIPSNAPNPHQALEKRELSSLIQKAVLALPVSLRIPLLLRRYQELSYEEIAEIVDCTVTAVKLRLHRAKRILAQSLAPYHQGGS